MSTTALALAPETPAQVLACLGEAQAAEDAAAAAKLRMALAWASMHSTDTLSPAFADWQEGSIPLAAKAPPRSRSSASPSSPPSSASPPTPAQR